VYVQHIFEKPRIQFYAGAGIGGGIDQFGIAPRISMISKRHVMYSLSYNVITRYTEVSASWLISFRKKH
jgi:hypothetical protein